MSAKETFSKNLRYMRTMKEITIQDISVDLDIQVSRYRMWEAGKAVPGCEILLMIGNYFDVSLDSLFRIDMEDIQRPY